MIGEGSGSGFTGPETGNAIAMRGEEIERQAGGQARLPPEEAGGGGSHRHPLTRIFHPSPHFSHIPVLKFFS